MAKKILTLNIGASAIALAEYEAVGSSLKLVNYGTAALAAPLDSGDAETILVPALMEIVREKGIKPGKVAVSLSGQMVFPRFAAIPMAGGMDRFEQLVRYEVEQNIPFPIDEMVCDRQILGDTESGDKSVMIVAAKIDQVEGITGALQSAGFVPEVVGVAPFAVTNVLRANAPDDGSCTVLLDIGAKTTSLVILEGEKIYNRSIPVAGNAITKEIAQALGCTLDEAEGYKRENAYVSMGGVTEDEDETLDRISKVCRAVLTRLHAEISRSINFYRSQQGGSAPSRMFLTGGSSVLPQLAEFFQDSLGIEVAYLNPFETIGVGGSVDAEALEMDGAVLAPTAGLALQVAGAAEININLIPQSILDAKAEVARIPFVAAGAAALVGAAAVWLVAAIGATSKIEEQIDPATAAANKAKATFQACEKAAKEFDEATAEAAKLTAQLARRDEALRHVQIVRGALDPHLWISSWQETVETRTVVDEPARGRIKEKTHEESVKVTKVAFRCWVDEKDEVVKAERERRQAEDDSSLVTSQTTPLEIVIHRLNATGKCVAEADREAGQSVYGPGDCLLQYKVEIQFKEDAGK